MATLTIKNLPPGLHQRLVERAARHRRSLNNELISCLEQVLRTRALEPDALLARVRQLRESLPRVEHGDIDTYKRHGRS